MIQGLHGTIPFDMSSYYKDMSYVLDRDEVTHIALSDTTFSYI